MSDDVVQRLGVAYHEADRLRRDGANALGVISIHVGSGVWAVLRAMADIPTNAWAEPSLWGFPILEEAAWDEMAIKVRLDVAIS